MSSGRPPSSGDRPELELQPTGPTGFAENPIQAWAALSCPAPSDRDDIGQLTIGRSNNEARDLPVGLDHEFVHRSQFADQRHPALLGPKPNPNRFALDTVDNFHAGAVVCDHDLPTHSEHTAPDQGIRPDKETCTYRADFHRVG